jgi:hypothetical protein
MLKKQITFLRLLSNGNCNVSYYPDILFTPVMCFIQHLGNSLENLGIFSKSMKTKFINDLPYKWKEGH